MSDVPACNNLAISHSAELNAGQPQADDRPRVLVADDNADMRQYIVRLLAEHCNVEAVTDAEAALALAWERPPDLIVADDRVDGFGLLKALRAEPRTKSLRVIILSDRAAEESRVNGMEIGADDCLVKPFTDRELVSRVSAHLQIARMRREASEALRQREEQLRALVSASSDVVYRMNADWTEMRYLQGLEFIADTPEPSRSWLVQYIPPEDQQYVMKAIHRAIRSKSAFELEHRVLLVDGTVGWTFSRAIPLLTGDGEIMEWFGAASDITDRKRAEQALLQSEAGERLRADELETVMAAVPAVVWIAHDPACQRITGNQASADLLRMSRQANQSLSVGVKAGQPVHFKVFKDGVELLPHELPVQLAATGVEVRDFEEEIVFEDGVRIHLFGHAMPLRDEAGQVRGSVAAFVDITDLKKAEEAVRKSEAQFRIMADNAPAMLWVSDPTGYCTYLNALWYEFTGRTPGKDVGYGWLAAIHPDDLAETTKVFLHANENHLPFKIDYRVLRHDGEYRWAVDTGLPRFDGDKFHGFVGCVFDVHERKIAEDANSQLVENLRHADQRKDEFLATLAHELRNPLAPIRNGLQIMRLASGDRDTTEQARLMMERQVAQMVHLVDDLLDLSRISRGKIELRKERIELGKAIQQAVETSRPAIEQAGHELLVEVPPEPLYVDADVTRLAQVFSNLLNNAAKYTEPGGRVRLAVQHLGTDAVVSVRDNGIGIPAHMLPHVFEIFTQVDRHLERSQGGLGIGLSIVKRLVQMHGGSVEANSDGHGMGSEFVVRLPVVLSVVQPQRDDEETPRSPSRHRILVVDDNRDAAVSLAMMLKLMGSDAKTAYDGLEALDVAATYQPDLILLDIGMPRMNGYDTARHIRQQPWGKGVVLVALTGWGQEQDRRKSQDAGFDFHLVKPIEPAALQKLLVTLQTDNGEQGEPDFFDKPAPQ